MAAQFQLVVRSGPDVGKVYLLRSQEISIGRENNNIIVINDAEVSRKHASLELHGSSYTIKDLGSTNGTFINGQRLSGDHVLKPGDAISFGEGVMMVFEVVYDSGATVSSTPARPVKPAAPARKPTPVPVPAPVPVAAAPKSDSGSYPGKAPEGPLPEEVVENSKKKKFPIWVVVLVILLIVICACVGFFVIIDQFRLWCDVVPFLVPMLGGTCA